MKLTTKLLLGATLVAGLSVSAFAACASDVDFGSTDGTNGKNITGLKDPTEAQHAATKAYVDGVSQLSWTLLRTHTCDGTPQHISLENNRLHLFALSAFHNTQFFQYQGKPVNSISLAYPYDVSVLYSDNADVNTTHINPHELKFNGTHINCTSGRIIKIYTRSSY